MGYIGLRTDNAGQFRTLDNLSSSFDGSQVTYIMTVMGIPIEVTDARQLLISIDGVIQEPNVSFSVSGINIIFSEAPQEGSTFWGILLGGNYDPLNRELINTTLLGAKYDDTLGPVDALTILTANTPGYSDNTTKVATTNFVRFRSVPWFNYYNTTHPNIPNVTSTIINFSDGDLTDSSVIMGQNWLSNEFTIPSTYYGIWSLDFKLQTANISNNVNYVLDVELQRWDGATWETYQDKAREFGSGISVAGTPISCHLTYQIKHEANYPKFRISVYRACNDGNSGVIEGVSLTGTYLGGHS